MATQRMAMQQMGIRLTGRTGWLKVRNIRNHRRKIFDYRLTKDTVYQDKAALDMHMWT